MADIDWADVRVGDPDPTPDEPPWCRAENAAQWRRTGEGYVCTRRPGHEPPHVAGDGYMPTAAVDFGRTVIAIWTDP